MKKAVRLFLIRTLLTLFFLGGIFYVITWYGFQKEQGNVKFGVTFSTVMARQLGLEPREVFDAILEDLGARKIRLPVYWTDVEKEQGKFDFRDYDYFVKQAEKNEATLILAIGQKLPRWPECFVPMWASNRDSNPVKSHQEAILTYIRAVVERYKTSRAVELWQVENEPFFKFGGECAQTEINENSLRLEVELIKSLDSSRPVVITDSGEQGLWYKAGRNGDILGITMYRQVWNKILGIVRFPFGPGLYAMKGWLFQLYAAGRRNLTLPGSVKSPKIIVIELQAEPWGPGKLLPDYSVELQKELMDAKRFYENISFARRTGFDTFYLWGAEWWFWLKEKHNDTNLWEEAKKLFK